jgi:hypothetical protein
MIASASSISPLHAAWVGAFMNGNALYDACMNRDPNSFCAGYIEGVADMASQVGLACLPIYSTKLQVTDMVKQYLTKHPEQRHYGASSTVQVALTEAFPCQKP